MNNFNNAVYSGTRIGNIWNIGPGPVQAYIVYFVLFKCSLLTLSLPCAPLPLGLVRQILAGCTSTSGVWWDKSWLGAPLHLGLVGRILILGWVHLYVWGWWDESWLGAPLRQGLVAWILAGCTLHLDFVARILAGCTFKSGVGGTNLGWVHFYVWGWWDESWLGALYVWGWWDEFCWVLTVKLQQTTIFQHCQGKTQSRRLT